MSPLDMKLEGATNYLSWSRRALLAVEQKELDGHLLGAVDEPGDETTMEGKRWKVINSVLVGWLLNSVVPPIGRSLWRDYLRPPIYGRLYPPNTQARVISC